MPRSGIRIFPETTDPLPLTLASSETLDNGVLLQSYRLGEFGRTYPLARGTAPLLVGAGAWVIVGEHLTALQIVGTCTIAGALPER